MKVGFTGGFRGTLLASTTLSVLLASPAVADQVLNGTTETIDGGGGGTIASPWNVSGRLYISTTSDTTLNVINGGQVTSDQGLVGDSPSSGVTGTVDVSGSGSTWTNTNYLDVGYQGQGVLTVENGGSVSDTRGTIGSLSGSAGTATVTGTGSNWASSSGLYVGFYGNGMLTVGAGGSASGRYGFVGTQTGTSGAVTVTGAGSSLSFVEGVTLGASGQGTLTITDGGAVSAGDTVNIARETGSAGTLNIGAAGGASAAGPGTLNAPAVQFGDGSGKVVFNHTSDSYTFAPGISGNGEIDHLAGTTTLTGDSSGFTGATKVLGGALGVNGQLGGSDGTVDTGGTATVSGGGAVWNLSDGLYAGYSGEGMLTVADGGKVSDTFGYLGALDGSHGTAIVTGAGSTWANSSLFVVGHTGVGSLTIADGGAVSNTTGYIGYNPASAPSTVRVTGDGSTWANSATLFVGRQGAGALTIEDGGTVGSASGDIGNFAGSAGAVTVTGGGSAWTNSGGLNVGDLGTGMLTIEDGGAVSNTFGAVGAQAGATGTATVSGTGASWTNSDGLFIGNESRGTLTVKDGGAVTSVQAFMGVNAGSTGTATVTGAGSSWTNDHNLFVGYGSEGTLTVANGGVVSTGEGAIGGMAGSTGVATVTGAGSKWMHASSSATSAVLFIGAVGTGTLTIADGGEVSFSATTDVAYGAGSAGTLNIGAAAGDAAAAPGTLDTHVLAFGAGTGRLVFNHTSDSYGFAAQIAGSGEIDQLAGTTVLTGDSSRFAGTTNVSGGTLDVNSVLGGTLNVLSGGRLQGSGTVATTNVAGTVAPGNSIGTLSVAGDVSFAAGSAYEVEVDDTGASDRIEATGAATIDSGSTVTVLSENGTDDGSSYAPETRYTILSAAGGVTGAFGSVSESFPLLDPELTYDADSVYLTLTRNDTSFAGLGGTRNERATAGGLDALGSGDALHDAIVPLTEPEALAAFDALSGEIHASLRSGLIEDSRFIREAIGDRLRNAVGDRTASAPPVLAYGPGDPAPAAPGTGDTAVWAQAYGVWGKTDGDGNAAELDRSSGGLFLGIDGPVAENWRAGIAAGYGHSSLDADARASSADIDSGTVAAYAGARFGALGLSFGAAHTWHGIDTHRSIAFPGFAGTADASYDARTAQIFGEAGYTLRYGEAAFEPFAGLAYADLHTDGFEENGAAGLAGAEGSARATFTTLGLRAAGSFHLGGIRTTAHAMLGWRHAFGDLTPEAALSFAGGAPFTVAGAPLADDTAIVEAGLDLDLSRTAAIGFAYAGQIGGGVAEHALKGRFTVRF